MRRITALLLALVLVIGLAPVARAKKAYTLDIYWIANKDDEAVRTGVRTIAAVDRNKILAVPTKDDPAFLRLVPLIIIVVAVILLIVSFINRRSGRKRRRRR